MPDTVRTRDQLTALFPDNLVGEITAQDARDLIVSAFGWRSIFDPSRLNDSVDSAGIGAKFDVGNTWINTNAFREWRCLRGTPGNAVWIGTSGIGLSGRDGKDGAPGLDGEDGQDGLPGRDGRDGAPGAAGPAGAPGAAGPAGAAGATGATGATGPAGATGATGATGAAGATGATGATGAAGPAGKDGRDGAPGLDGEDGQDGLPGRDGKDGAPGATGAAGPAGKDGHDGQPGQDGEDGQDGAPGKDGAAGSSGVLQDSTHAYAVWDFDRSEIGGTNAVGESWFPSTANGGSAAINAGLQGTYYIAMLANGSGNATGQGGIQLQSHNVVPGWNLTAFTSIQVDFRLYLDHVSTVGQQFSAMFGFGNNVLSNPTDGVFFSYTDTVNSGKWQCNCVKTTGGGGTTTADSGVTPTANTIATFTIKVTGTTAVFSINGSVVATISSNVPTANGGLVANLLKLNGTTLVIFGLDRVSLTITF